MLVNIATVALNHEEIQEKVTRKIFLKNLTPALNVLYVYMNMYLAYTAYISKNNTNHEKRILLLTIPNGKGWHYLSVKNYLRY